MASVFLWFPFKTDQQGIHKTNTPFHDFVPSQCWQLFRRGQMLFFRLSWAIGQAAPFLALSHVHAFLRCGSCSNPASGARQVFDPPDPFSPRLLRLGRFDSGPRQSRVSWPSCEVSESVSPKMHWFLLDSPNTTDKLDLRFEFQESNDSPTQPVGSHPSSSSP